MSRFRVLEVAQLRNHRQAAPLGDKWLRRLLLLRLQCKHAGLRYRVNRRPSRYRKLNERKRAINRSRSRTGARGEHAFHVVKRLWGFAKVRHL